MRYEQLYDGEWFTPRRRNYPMACCHCGLVHRMDIRIIGKKVQMRLFEDRRATAGMRRGKELIMTMTRKSKSVKKPKVKPVAHEELAAALHSLAAHVEQSGGRDLPVVQQVKSIIERLKD